MTEFQQVNLRNFRNHKETSLDLQDKNLILIHGKNGSGKSSIAYAICWILFGRLPRGSKVEGAIGPYDNTVNGSVQMNVNDNSFYVERTAGRTASKSALKVMFNNEEKEGTIPELNKFICQTLGFDFDLFQLLAMFSNGAIKYFARSVPAERFAVLENVFGLDKLQEAYKKTNKKLKKLVKDQVSLDTDIENKGDILRDGKKELKKLKLEAHTWQERIDKECSGLEKQIKDLEQELEELEAPELPEKQDETTLKKLRDEIDKYKTKIILMQKDESDLLKKAFPKRVKNLDDLVGEPCPTCERKITQACASKVHKREQEEIAEATTEYEDLKKKIEKELDKLDKLRSKAADIENVQEEYKDELSRYESKKYGIEVKMSYLKEQLEEKQNTENPYETTVKRNQATLEKINKKLKAKREELKEVNRQYEIMTIVEYIFSKTGLRAMYIEELVTHLCKTTKGFLYRLSGGVLEDLNMWLDDKNRINVEIFRDDKKMDYWDFSDGERHRIDMAFVFGLNRVAMERNVVKIKTMFLDEILDISLDDEGQEEAFEILQSLIDDGVNSIFVISHRASLMYLFDKSWEVKNGRVDTTTNRSIENVQD